ncbi:toll/interleukin-1 receptor domain-containing protein [Actinokineospora sp. NPDC004072]
MSVSGDWPVGDGPKVFVSYAHDSIDHRTQVLRLCELLARLNIRVTADFWAEDRRRDWAAWTTGQIVTADYVLVVASPRYHATSTGEPGVIEGRGVQSEAAILRELIHSDRTTWLPKVLPIILPGRSVTELPTFLQPRSASHYAIPAITPAGVELLMRVLTNQPAYIRPTSARTPHLPPRSTGYHGQSSGAAPPTMIGDLIDEPGTTNHPDDRALPSTASRSRWPKILLILAAATFLTLALFGLYTWMQPASTGMRLPPTSQQGPLATAGPEQSTSAGPAKPGTTAPTPTESAITTTTSTTAITSDRTPDPDVPKVLHAAETFEVGGNSSHFADLETSSRGMGGSFLNETWDIRFPYADDDKFHFAITQYAAPMQSEPTFDQCAKAAEVKTDSAVDRVYVEPLGSWYCIRTREGNTAAIQVTGTGENNKSVTITYVVWDTNY